jgi:hypothetical protein
MTQVGAHGPQLLRAKYHQANHQNYQQLAHPDAHNQLPLGLRFTRAKYIQS